MKGGRMKDTDVIMVLAKHVGAKQGISAEDLVMEITESEEPSPAGERKLRDIIATLRRQGVRICGHPSTGYYLAATPEELNQTCSFLRKRALSSLHQEARLRGIALPELLGQLNLQLAPPAEVSEGSGDVD
jgi:hypothetical protein